MKVKVSFECEVYSTEYTPWFAVDNELNHTNLEQVNNLQVFDAETNEEL